MSTKRIKKIYYVTDLENMEYLTGIRATGASADPVFLWSDLGGSEPGPEQILQFSNLTECRVVADFLTWFYKTQFAVCSMQLAK